jgi:hypothetical protein
MSTAVCTTESLSSLSVPARTALPFRRPFAAAPGRSRPARR